MGRAKLVPQLPVDMSKERSITDDLFEYMGFDSAAMDSTEDVMTYPTDPVDWIQTHFWIPELNGPLKLFPYHQLVLREAYRTDKDGNYVYDTIIWSDIKKVLSLSSPQPWWQREREGCLGDKSVW